MYFIEDGEVAVYDVIEGREEIKQLVLGPGKSFGEPQGLYGLPYYRTDKTRFTTRILILDKKNWKYLLKWFPASKEEIEEQAQKRFKFQRTSLQCSL